MYCKYIHTYVHAISTQLTFSCFCVYFVAMKHSQKFDPSECPITVSSNVFSMDMDLSFLLRPSGNYLATYFVYVATKYMYSTAQNCGENFGKSSNENSGEFTIALLYLYSEKFTLLSILMSSLVSQTLPVHYYISSVAK